jgi:hypothetical protein
MVRNLRNKLEHLRTGSKGRGPSEEEKAIVKKLKRALHQEEIWMKQRSRILWLHEGDKNTSYFHRCAAQRRRTNKIELLQRADGTLCDSMDDAHSELLDVVQPKVSQVMNDGMDAPYTEEEIKKALFQMAPSNSQGLTVLLQVSSSDIGLSLKMMW